MLKTILSILNESRKTTETKAVLVGSLWALAARFVPGVPTTLPQVDFSAIGLGTLALSPAVLFLIALVRVVKKVATDGETPFYPSPSQVKPASGGAVVPIVALALVALAGPALAADRVSAGLSAGPALVQRDDGSTFAGVPQAWAGYSVSDRVTASAILEAEYAVDARPCYVFAPGFRLNLERSADWRLAAGVEFVAALGPEDVADSWRAVLVGSRILSRGADGRPALSADLRPTLDFESGKAQWRLAIKWFAL